MFDSYYGSSMLMLMHVYTYIERCNTTFWLQCPFAIDLHISMITITNWNIDLSQMFLLRWTLFCCWCMCGWMRVSLCVCGWCVSSTCIYWQIFPLDIDYSGHLIWHHRWCQQWTFPPYPMRTIYIDFYRCV